jgi:hypothetical protein
LLATGPDNAAKISFFKEAAFDIALRTLGNGGDRPATVDVLSNMALAHNFFGLAESEVETIIGDGFTRAEREHEDQTDRERLYAEADARAARMNGKDEGPPPIRFQSQADFLKGFVPPDYIVDGVLQRRFIYSMTGRTGGGKTAIALALA